MAIQHALPVRPFNLRVASRSRRLGFPTVTVFFLPLLTIWTINLGGELMFSDIAVALLLPFLLLSKGFSVRQPYLRPILLLLGLWFLGAIVSDVLNGNSMRNLLRGEAGIIFFGFHLLVFFVLINGRRERYVAAIIGIAVATLLGWLTGRTELSSEELTDTPWKMGNGFAVTLLLTAISASRLRSNRKVGQIVILSSPVHLFLNARSLFLRTALAGVISTIAMHTRSARQRKIILVAIGGIFAVGLPVGEVIYGQLTASGIFGREAQQKYEEQTANGTINILLGGRTESLVSLHAIADAPIFGHGSWAQNRKYYYEYLSALDAIGLNTKLYGNWNGGDPEHPFLIPTHSMLLGSWVYHGIFGGAFWVFVLVLALRAIGHGIVGQTPVQTLDLLVLITLVWDIFFSPFGEARRCTEAVYIVTACVLLAQCQYGLIGLAKYPQSVS